MSAQNHQPSGAAGRGRSRAIIAVGGAALAVSPFFTWMSVFLLGDLNLFQLMEVGGHNPDSAWLAVALGGFIAAFAWLGERATDGTRVVGVTVGIFAGLIAISTLTSLAEDVREAEGLAQVSYGPWIAFLGCAAMVVGGLLPDRGRATEAMENEADR